MKNIYVLLVVLSVTLVISFSKKSNHNDVVDIKKVNSVVKNKVKKDFIKANSVSDGRESIEVSVARLEKEIEKVEENLDLDRLLRDLNDKSLPDSEREKIINTVNAYAYKLSELANLESEIIEKRVVK